MLAAGFESMRDWREMAGAVDGQAFDGFGPHE